MAAPTSSFSVNQSTIGVDLNNTSTTQLFALGTKVFGTQNSEWVYVQAATSVTAYKMVYVNGTFTVGMASGGDLISGLGQIAVAQNAFAASEYGWVCFRADRVGLMCTGSVSVNNQLFLAASSTPTGICSISASASGTIVGVSLVTVVDTANATVHSAVLTWPRPGAPAPVL